jgi:hypothetical protein
MTPRRRRRAFVLRDDGQLFALLDRRVAAERRTRPGQHVTREGIAREILHAWLRYLSAPPPPG